MKATLPTNYQDDILNVSTEGKRKYRLIYNDDNTVSLIDVTPYDQEGSDYGAGDINATNQAVNESFDKNKLIRDMDAINALTEEGYAPDALALKDVNDSLGGLQFGVDENGNYGYIKAGADSVTPFRNVSTLEASQSYTAGTGTTSTASVNVANPDVKQALFLVMCTSYYHRPSNTYITTFSGDISNYELLAENFHLADNVGYGLRIYKCDITPNGTTNVKISNSQADKVRMGVTVLF